MLYCKRGNDGLLCDIKAAGQKLLVKTPTIVNSCGEHLSDLAFSFSATSKRLPLKESLHRHTTPAKKTYQGQTRCFFFVFDIEAPPEKKLQKKRQPESNQLQRRKQNLRSKYIG